MPVILNMTTKADSRITDKAYTLENGVLTVLIDVGDYSLTGKAITATFSNSDVETDILTHSEGIISLPIKAGYLTAGINFVQLNFRWGEDNLEQSGQILWKVESSLSGTSEINVSAGFVVGVDMEIVYENGEGIIDTSLTVPSDLLIKTGADKTLELNSPVWDDLKVPVNAVKPAGEKPPGWESWIGGLYLYWFDASTEEEVWFAVQMPHTWAGTAITPHVHWTPKTTADGTPANQAVEWGLEYTWADVGGDFPATNTIYGHATIQNDANVVANRHYKTNFDDISPLETQDGLSSMLVCRLFRNATGVNDTYEADAGLLEFDIHYEVNTLGSRTVGAK